MSAVVAPTAPAERRLATAERAAAVLLEHLPLETGVQAVAPVPGQKAVLLAVKAPLSTERQQALRQAAAGALCWFGLAGVVAVRIAAAGSAPVEAPRP